MLWFGSSTILAMLLAAASAPQDSAAQARAELVTYVARFTGAERADCGQHSFRPGTVVREELERSLACALDSVKAGRPFWTLNAYPGIDSRIFDGLLGSTEGAIYRFTFDSAPCGSPAACNGRFSVERCEKPFLLANFRGSLTGFGCQR